MTGKGSPVCLVYTTLPNEEIARSIAMVLVDRGLAACANMLPGMRAIYRWNGEVAEDGETVLILKTPPGRVADLVAALADLHPYEVPAIVELPAKANPAFADWVTEETESRAGS